MTYPRSGSPSLEYYRKQAKALLKAYAAGEPQALARFQQHHPRLAGVSPESVRSAALRLADAHLVLARENGFPSWPRFQAHLHEEAARQAGAGASECPPTGMAGASLLVVDDEPDCRETLGELFTGMGFQVTCAATAEEALGHLNARFFNVALIDVRLPDMRGQELLERMRAISRDTVGIFITGYASVDAAVRALNAHAYWFFEKPLDLERVAEVVLAALREQEGTMAARRLMSHDG